MKKIQYVKLLGLLTILLFLNISCKDDDTGLLTKHILPQQSKHSLLLSQPCLAGLLKTAPLHYCH